MKRWAPLATGAALASILLGCPAQDGAKGELRPTGLKVPLPDGWKASASDDGVLHIKAQGREVMSMEVRADAALPATDALEAAIAEGGGESLGALPLPDGVLVRYRVSTGAEGVLGVRRLGARRLLCASHSGAQQSELKTVARLCTETQ